MAKRRKSRACNYRVNATVAAGGCVSSLAKARALCAKFRAAARRNRKFKIRCAIKKVR